MITDNMDIVFKPIEHEKYRTYVFIYNTGKDKTVTIVKPLFLNVSSSGGHRILSADGVSHYIPSGWIHLYWEVTDNINFRF